MKTNQPKRDLRVLLVGTKKNNPPYEMQKKVLLRLKKRGLIRNAFVIDIEDNLALIGKLGITELPASIFYLDDVYIGKIYGVYDETSLHVFMHEVQKHKTGPVDT